MLFLTPFYQFISTHFEGKINHFPLIRLVLYSLDKTILYFLIFIVLRLIWRFIVKHNKRQRTFDQEALLWVFVFYILLLFSLTVFRTIYYPWDIKLYFHRSVSDINLSPLSETLKLTQGHTLFDFIYNSLGNILWFIPFGYLYPRVKRRPTNFFLVVLIGLLVSVSIETLQFLLYSGVADIDDVIFNTIGTIIGYGLHRLLHGHHRPKKRRIK